MYDLHYRNCITITDEYKWANIPDDIQYAAVILFIVFFIRVMCIGGANYLEDRSKVIDGGYYSWAACCQ